MLDRLPPGCAKQQTSARSGGIVSVDADKDNAWQLYMT